MAFQTGGIIEEPKPFQVGGEIDEPVAVDIAGDKLNRRDFLTEFIFSDKPVEKWLPSDQAALATQLIEDLEDPDEFRARISNTMMLAELFGVEPGNIIGIEPEILKKMFGKELTSKAGSVELKNGFAKLDPFAGFKAAAQSAAQKPALALKGLTAFTPGQGFGADKLLEISSDYLLSLGDETKRIQVEASLQGLLWPSEGDTPWYKIEPKRIPEAINTWAANIGDYIPLMIMTRTGQVLGKLIGKPAGAAVAAGVGIITGGPDPTDIATVPAVAAITEKILTHVGGAAPLIAIEAGGFLLRAEQMGIDKDIAEEYARIYGPSSGAIEYAQTLWNLKAFKRLGSDAKKTVLRTIIRELGGAAIEGFEEVTQGGLENFLLGKAIDAQKIRNPNFEAEKPPIFEDADRKFAIGAGLSFVASAGAKSLSAISTKDNIGLPPVDGTDAQAEQVAVEPVAEVGAEAAITPPEIEVTEEAAEEFPEIPVEKRIISREAFEAARKRLTETKLRTGLSPQDFTDAVVIGGFFVETGVRKFTDWSKTMIKELGESVRPSLRRIWSAIQIERDIKVPEVGKTKRQIKQDVADDVRNDPIFQIEEEAQDVRSREVDVGVFFVPPELRGEARAALEADPSLQFNLTFDRSKGVLIDEAVQEGLELRTGGTAGQLDINVFFERLSERKRGKRKIAGISEVLLDKMIASGNPFSEIAAVKHKMLAEGFTVDEINEEIETLAEDNNIDPEPFFLKEIEDVKESKGISRKAQKTQRDIEKVERKAEKRGEKVGFKAGESASREKAKVAVQKLKQAQKLNEARRNVAVELVKEFIDKEKRGDFLKRVADAKSARDLEKIAEAVEKGILRAEKREAIANLNKAVKAINPKKLLPEFADTAQSIIDSFQLGKLRPDTEIKNSDLIEMARQVLNTAREDSVAAFQAQQLLDELIGKTAKTFAVNNLSLNAIEQITDTLIALKFQSEADTIAAKDENATEAIRRREEISGSIVEPPVISESFGGQQVKKFKLLHDNLESVLDATAGARPGTYDLWRDSKNPTTEFIYDVLDKGVDNQIIHNRTARDILRGILDDNSVTKEDILNWSMRPSEVSIVKRAFGFGPKPVVHKFTLQDAKKQSTEFDFTSNELMSIFMHARNNHNLAVLLNDGMDRIVKGKKQKIRGFTIEVIDDMIDSLTDQQKTVARQTGSSLMDGFNRDSINKTSVKLEFFELAKVENYWPAKRSIIRTIKGKVISGVMKTIESMGLLKERVGIGNPMLLSGFFETVHGSNKNVSTYVGLAEPLREVKSVYTTSTIEQMENNGRGAEAKLITDLIVRFEDQSSIIQPLDTVLKRMLAGFAKSVLFLNPKIATRQQLSQLLISAYVDVKYMAEFRGISTKELIKEIADLSPQTSARFDGLQFDRDVGDSFAQNQLMNYLTGDITLIDKTALGMKFFDTNAIVNLYRAVKAEVIDKNPGIDITSNEGKALLKERFEWVLRHTQPMWQIKDRSLLGSDTRPLVRGLTMFMSQREQLVRMINNGIADFVNSEKTTEDQVRLGRTLGAVAMNMALFTIYNLAWAVLIQRKEKDVKDLGKAFLKDIISLPFFGKYIATSFELVFDILTDTPGFRRTLDEGPFLSILSLVLVDAIPNYARAGKHFVSGEKYKSGPNRGHEKWPIELLVATDALAEAITSVKGITYRGAKDIVKSVKAQIPEKKKEVVRRSG